MKATLWGNLKLSIQIKIWKIWKRVRIVEFPKGEQFKRNLWKFHGECKFGYTSRGCFLFQNFRKMLFCLWLEFLESLTRTFRWKESAHYHTIYRQKSKHGEWPFRRFLSFTLRNVTCKCWYPHRKVGQILSSISPTRAQFRRFQKSAVSSKICGTFVEVSWCHPRKIQSLSPFFVEIRSNSLSLVLHNTGHFRLVKLSTGRFLIASNNQGFSFCYS